MPRNRKLDAHNHDSLHLSRFGVHVRPDWYDDAKCRGMGPDIFYPDPGRYTNLPALAVCAGCPVRQACADHAISEKEKDGIWGGMTETGRRPYARRAAARKRAS